MRWVKTIVVVSGIVSLLIYSAEKESASETAKAYESAKNANDMLTLEINNDIDLNTVRAPFQVKDVTVRNGVLELVVAYFGGCGEHEFGLMTHNDLSQSVPVQAALLLTHDPQGDECKTLLSKELRFDLQPLRALYEEQFGLRTGSVMLRVRDYDLLVRYDF